MTIWVSNNIVRTRERDTSKLRHCVFKRFSPVAHRRCHNVPNKRSHIHKEFRDFRELSAENWAGK